MATAFEQLEAMRRLAENWDGYGAAAPLPQAIDQAQTFIRGIEAARAEQLHVSPTRTGGALIEWVDGMIEHEAEFYPDGPARFLSFNKETGKIETSKGAMLSRPFQN